MGKERTVCVDVDFDSCGRAVVHFLLVCDAQSECVDSKTHAHSPNSTRQPEHNKRNRSWRHCERSKPERRRKREAGEEEGEIGRGW